MLKNNKGFTLIEMLIVLMIISVLIILIVPNLGGKSKEVNDKGCDALVSVVQAQVDAYYLDNGNYPLSLDVLKSANYITEDQTTCPNKKKLGYADGKVKSP
ncbi:competence type IV pilus major pilin ComGC [Virgibacillus alimentarius]|uniref:ComG operon protein 3 n=1 Tax=Virgibacillus alimentarius TaxID=698769 RepID=A0ABS4S4S5_9BACI|nr:MULTISPECIES: competence type IV pilus major pilin ComGC [Virgibacillus]MBP2256500.1 competence protein ComGC [Virgibacillus alimentarius]HLR66446.1 competence type IV pilus major pilin ComGC [Virgibacillus sp.]